MIEGTPWTYTRVNGVPQFHRLSFHQEHSKVVITCDDRLWFSKVEHDTSFTH